MPPRNEESEERKARATYPARTIETPMRELTVLRRNLFIAGKEPLLGVCSREIERRVALRRASNIHAGNGKFFKTREKTFLFLFRIVHVCRFVLSLSFFSTLFFLLCILFFLAILESARNVFHERNGARTDDGR